MVYYSMHEGKIQNKRPHIKGAIYHRENFMADFDTSLLIT